MYKNLATPIRPEEIRISEIKWDESNERRKGFILKKKKKKKLQTSFFKTFQKNFGSEAVFFNPFISIRQFIFQN